MQSILGNSLMTNQNIYTVGGSVPTTGGIFIKRRADDELLGLCRAGEYLHVLSPSQMGKSSLILNIGKKLEAEGFVTVYVDLTCVGKEQDPDKWFLGFLYCFTCHTRIFFKFLPVNQRDCKDSAACQ